MTPTRYETRINECLLIVVQLEELDRLKRSGADISEVPDPCWSWVIRWTSPGPGVLRRWDLVDGLAGTPVEAAEAAWVYFRAHIQTEDSYP
jgi:hypothetical protein